MDYKESFIIFRVGGRNFATSVSNVLEVTENKELSPLPGAPEYVSGIKKFRDGVIPIVNTIEKLEIEKQETSDKPNKYIVVFEIKVSSETKRFGALIDKVLSVGELSTSSVKVVDDIQDAMSPAPYIKGVINSPQGFIYVLLPEFILWTVSNK